MVKLVMCLRRLPHLTLAEFQEYWLQKHAALALKHAKALSIRRYVQTHTVDNPQLLQAMAASRGAPEAYDGVAELWWDDMESFLAATSTPEGRAAGKALLEDERNFIDHALSPIWISEEHEIIAGK